MYQVYVNILGDWKLLNNDTDTINGWTPFEYATNNGYSKINELSDITRLVNYNGKEYVIPITQIEIVR